MDPTSARGARNLVLRALSLTAGERLHVLVYRADDVAEPVEHAAREAGVDVRRLDLEPLASRAAPSTRGAVAAAIVREIRGSAATLLLAKAGIPSVLSVAVTDAATELGTRHAHVVRVERDMLGQSLRAEPEILAGLNARLAKLLAPPCTVRVRSPAGTALEIGLGPAHPLITANGQPIVGRWETFPSGYVSTHPAKVRGTLVVDRNVLAAEARGLAAAVRRSPVRFELEDARVVRFACDDRELSGVVERYLASDPNAARVGLVLFPTNYLVRAETGMESQDELAPGVNVNLGFSSQAATHARYEAPVQLRLLGRRQSIEVRGHTIVDAGRLADEIAAGIDPFR